jgi:hypothetical protein
VTSCSLVDICLLFGRKYRLYLQGRNGVSWVTVHYYLSGATFYFHLQNGSAILWFLIPCCLMFRIHFLPPSSGWSTIIHAISLKSDSFLGGVCCLHKEFIERDIGMLSFSVSLNPSVLSSEVWIHIWHVNFASVSRSGATRPAKDSMLPQSLHSYSHRIKHLFTSLEFEICVNNIQNSVQISWGKIYYHYKDQLFNDIYGKVRSLFQKLHEIYKYYSMWTLC